MSNKDSDVKINIIAKTAQAVGNIFRLNLSVESIVGTLINAAKAAAQFAKDLVSLGLSMAAAKAKGTLLLGTVEAYNAHVRAAQEATRGLLTEQQAMVLVNDLVNFGFSKSTQETGELARQIMVLSGGNIEAARSFTKMMTNASALRLDDFSLSSAVATRRIEELRKANSDLTREEAFAIAVKEQLAEKTEILGDTLETSEAKVARMQSALQDLKGDAATTAAAGVSPLIDAIDELNDKLSETSEAGVKVENAFMAFGTAEVTAITAVRELIAGNVELNEVLDRAKDYFVRLGTSNEALSTTESRAAEDVAALEAAQRQEALAAKEAAIAKKAAAEANKELASSTEEVTQVLADQQRALMGLAGVFAETTETTTGGLQGSASTIAANENKMSDEDFLQLGLRLLINEGAPMDVIWAYRKASGLAESDELAKEQAMLNLVQQAANREISAEEYLSGIQSIRAGNIPEMTTSGFGLGGGSVGGEKSRHSGGGEVGEQMAKEAAKAIATQFNKSFPEHLNRAFEEIMAD